MREAGDRHTLVDVDLGLPVGPGAGVAEGGSPRSPPERMSPSRSPADHRQAQRGAGKSPKTPNKRALPSASGGPPTKLIKTASTTPVRATLAARHLPATADPGTHRVAKMREEDPWARYRKVYEIMIDGFVTVAIRKDKTREPVIVRRFLENGPPAAETKKLHELHHENILTLESFSFEGYRHLILERISVSLVDVVACPHYLSVPELVAILKQVSPRSTVGICY